jgi:hypothetical protein
LGQQVVPQQLWPLLQQVELQHTPLAQHFEAQHVEVLQQLEPQQYGVAPGQTLPAQHVVPSG